MQLQAKEMVIRLKHDATVICEEIFENNLVVSKHISIEDLCSAVNNSIRLEGVETGILPEGCIYFKEDMDKNRYIVLKYNNAVDFSLYETVYKNLPLPTLLFGFKIQKNGHINKRMITCIKGNKIKMDTKLCYYPFSNVYNNNFNICLGNNRLKDIKSIIQIEAYPYYIMSLTNNNDLYNQKHNSCNFEYRELLDYISKKGEFNDDLLVERDITVRHFIEALIDIKIKENESDIA
ncbi:MAG TPA: hypothetical protein PK733_17405 [Clostridiales bacterium]|nr:hypothetical protein [Clostridiales bacterium]